MTTPRAPFYVINVHLWIELPWPENPVNIYIRHTETLDSCFNFIRTHQQCIPWSPLLEIESVTTDCSAKTLQLSHQFISHTSDTKLTSHSNMSCVGVTGFSGQGNSIHNIIPLLKKGKCKTFICLLFIQRDDNCCFYLEGTVRAWVDLGWVRYCINPNPFYEYTLPYPSITWGSEQLMKGQLVYYPSKGIIIVPCI